MPNYKVHIRSPTYGVKGRKESSHRGKESLLNQRPGEQKGKKRFIRAARKAKRQGKAKTFPRDLKGTMHDPEGSGKATELQKYNE